MAVDELDRYWKTVVNTIQDGIMIVDTHGRIISVNNAFEFITGYSKDDLIGKTCDVLNCNLFEAARNKKGDHWCVLFDTGTMDRRRCTLVKKDGTLIHALKNASILHDAKGQLIGAVETIADITEIIEKDNQIAAFRRELRSKDGFHGIIGVSYPMRQVFDLIENAAQSDAPVIIYGESGTGKELVSKAIHEISERKNGALVKV
ncbi:MAG: PAS domain S-box protein, partial [Desulfobacteraceae bacterium]|nr:PAS domain S-box protein [Desulfobacteraceae bacterium]